MLTNDQVQGKGHTGEYSRLAITRTFRGNRKRCELLRVKLYGKVMAVQMSAVRSMQKYSPVQLRKARLVSSLNPNRLHLHSYGYLIFIIDVQLFTAICTTKKGI